MILATMLAMATTACAGSGFEVRSVGFSPEFTAGVARTMDTIVQTPKCKQGEALVTERQADVRTVSDSNGVRSRQTVGQPGRQARQVSERDRRRGQLFVGQETRIRASSDSICVPIGN